MAAARATLSAGGPEEPAGSGETGPSAAEVDALRRSDRMFVVALGVLLASYVVVGAVVVNFDRYAPTMSDALAEFWSYDVPPDDMIDSGDTVLVLALLALANVVALSLVYWVVRDAGDVLNYSGVDLGRIAGGGEPKHDVPPVALRSFLRSIVIGAWIGAAATALYGLVTRDVEAVAYGPVLGLLFGSLLYPGIDNFVRVIRGRG